MNFLRAFSTVFCCSLVGTAVFGQNEPRNPFAPPLASIHYALDRTCDLINIDIDIDVDYPNRTYKGTTVNTLSPLRNGLTEVMLMAGPTVELSSVKVDGVAAKYRRVGRNVFVTTSPLVKGKLIKIEISYSAKNSKARPFGGGGGGFHWIEPTKTNATRIGFWTQGEAETNSEWAPTWDYPNDLATSNTRCTVQADWDMIGNGKLMGVTLSPDKSKKTYTWKMTQPHATYLLTLVGGPLDIKKDKWEGMDLWYAVPRGSGYLIDNSFAHTKDMLNYFSKVTGVKYPWPKYAQNAMYDFGGGMENVSATTLGEGSLTEARDGYFLMDSLNSHELAHQWFGDLVTCKDWGDTWLNESFATFMQHMYFEYSQGKNSHDWEIEGAMRAYFAESRRYKRPISSKMYINGDAMFDSHAYPKGGTVLHTLRKMLGDEAFWSGINLYLKQHQYTPVESFQLRRSMTEATGINVEPFWDQWIDKPGHPVLDYSWTYEGSSVKLTVKQLQDTKDGTPIYNIPAKVALMDANGKATILPVQLSKAEETFVLASATQPSAVVFDPEHEFLREIPKLNWSESELPIILKYGKNAPDRVEAMRRLLEKPTDENIKMITDVIAADTTQSPVFPSQALFRVSNLKKPELRAFWTKQVDHVNFGRRAIAVIALGLLPADPVTTLKIRSLVNDKAPIQVVVNAISALATWDKVANADVIKQALTITDRRGAIKAAAERALK